MELGISGRGTGGNDASALDASAPLEARGSPGPARECPKGFSRSKGPCSARLVSLFFLVTSHGIELHSLTS